MITHKKEKGFTIIEVVLVLAIAALIFLMVFIALPGLQRSQRDSQRKNDLSRALNAVTSYTSNNRGALPAGQTGWNGLITNYLTAGGDTFIDPSGSDYAFKVTGTVPSAFDPEAPNIYVTVGSVCNGESLVANQGTRKVALQMKLEGGGIDCRSN